MSIVGRESECVDAMIRKLPCRNRIGFLISRMNRLVDVDGIAHILPGDGLTTLASIAIGRLILRTELGIVLLLVIHYK